METLSKEFVPYQEALELKELGFDEHCLAIYTYNNEYYKEGTFFLHHPHPFTIEELKPIVQDIRDSSVYILAPTFSQVFRWFREKYNLFGCIDLQVCTPAHWYIRIDNIIKNDYIYHSEDEDLKFNTYEEAELACLRKLIEIVKNEHR